MGADENEIKVHVTLDGNCVGVDRCPCRANVGATIKPAKEERTKGGDALAGLTSVNAAALLP
ncbi:hypothetical protein K0M31_018181 [Melipona bicolor]|uniref:Uncharacterized protein n=1 Tax=Melipona bicolor TaxID=60889 RepID=A0AA40FCW9_9HYME|nr:hypothetical protein K0M31_018181 [Melipona bicolor]